MSRFWALWDGPELPVPWSTLAAGKKNCTRRAHEASSGWRYDRNCCSGHDCAVDRGKITPIDQGWLIERHGLVIPYKSYMLHKSRDGLFHSCWLQGDDTKPENLLCLYVPPMGS